MNPRSAKAKGGNFEKFCLEQLRQIDEKAYRVFGSGAGLQKGDLYCPNLNWIIECKNHRTPHLGQWLNQLERQANDANKSVLLFKKPKSADISPEIYALVSLTDLMQISSLRATQGPIISEKNVNSRELEYTLRNLAILCKKAMKMMGRE